MIRYKNWLVMAVALAAVLAGGYYYTQANGSDGVVVESQEPEIQTATVRQGELVISALGAGTVVPAAEINLGFRSAGVLTGLAVRVGDTVAAGDELARIDTAEAEQGLINAELALAKLMMQSDATTAEAGTSYNEIALAQAQLNLSQAENFLNELRNWSPDEGEIAVAEANVAAAEAGLNSAQGQSSSAYYGLEISQLNLTQAERSLAEAQANHAAVWDEARDWEVVYTESICDAGEQEPCTGQTWADRIARERESADTSLLRAQEDLQLAQFQYNQTAAGNSNGSSVASAETSLLNAQLSLTAAQTGPTEAELEAAEAAVLQAELAYQQALLNQESGLLDLEQARLNVVAAQTALTETVLVAPIAGTIMEVTAEVGESVGTATFILLADLEQPVLEIFLDESDLNMVGVGFEVEVVFDALPDDTFVGTIVQVDPQLTEQSGLNVVRAVMQLNEESFAKPQTLPVGLNATVEVIGGRAENALLIPVEALRELTPENYSVFVMNGDDLELRSVEVGLADFTFAEITAGLEAGEIVTTGIVETE